jgi:hypothetical protein
MPNSSITHRTNTDVEISIINIKTNLKILYIFLPVSANAIPLNVTSKNDIAIQVPKVYSIVILKI